MKSKATLVFLLLFLIGVVLSACATTSTTGMTSSTTTISNSSMPSETSTESSTTEVKTKRIFMSNAYYTAPFCAPLNKGIENKAKELGYEIQIVDGEGNADKQLAQFKAAVSEGYDAFIYLSADLASQPPVVEFLNSTGLPWILQSSGPDPSIKDKVRCTVASDEIEIGRNIARIASEYLKNEGEVVYIEGAAGASYTENVTIGLNEIFGKTNIKILNDHQYSDWDPGKAMKLMEDFLTKYGKDNIDLVICQDGGMFQGAVSALDAAGLKGKLMCVAAGNDLIIKESLLDGSLLATSLQDPLIEGALGVESLDKLIKGENVDSFVKTPGGLCYKEDVDEHNWF